MDAHKKTPKPVSPPATVYLELTEDEYRTVVEGTYQLYYRINSGQTNATDTAFTEGLKGEESMEQVAYRLYNQFPSVKRMREG